MVQTEIGDIHVLPQVFTDVVQHVDGHVAQAKAFYEAKFGKGSKADGLTNVWKKMHPERSSSSSSSGAIHKMAAVIPEGLTEEDAHEIELAGMSLAVDLIEGEDGLVKFSDFFKFMVENLGDGIRTFTPSIYLGAKAKVSPEVRKQMDKEDAVYDFDINADFNTLSNEQESSDSLWSADGSDSEAVSDSAGDGMEG